MVVKGDGDSNNDGKEKAKKERKRRVCVQAFHDPYEHVSGVSPADRIMFSPLPGLLESRCQHDAADYRKIYDEVDIIIHSSQNGHTCCFSASVLRPLSGDCSYGRSAAYDACAVQYDVHML